MVSGRIKLQLFAFLLLSGGVAANVLIFQPLSQARQVAEAPADPADKYTGFGNTGALGDEAPRPRYSDAKSAKSAKSTKQTPAQIADVTRAVQRELLLRGYQTGGSDGAQTFATRGAIMAFEYDHGMPLTGHPSQPLLKSILLGEGRTKRGAKVSKGQSDDAKELIRFVQEALAGLGYRPGAASGQFNNDTKVAIRKFERDQALPVSGRVSGALIVRLERLRTEGRIAAAP